MILMILDWTLEIMEGFLRTGMDLEGLELLKERNLNNN